LSAALARLRRLGTLLGLALVVVAALPAIAVVLVALALIVLALGLVAPALGLARALRLEPELARHGVHIDPDGGFSIRSRDIEVNRAPDDADADADGCAS